MLKTVPHLLRSFIWPVINSDLMSLCWADQGVGSVVSAVGGLNTHRFNRGRIIIRSDQQHLLLCESPLPVLALLAEIDVDSMDVTYLWWIHFNGFTWPKALPHQNRWIFGDSPNGLCFSRKYYTFRGKCWDLTICYGQTEPKYRNKFAVKYFGTWMKASLT